MKAFLSYSIKDSDQIIISLLSTQLREKGFHVLTSQNFFSEYVDYTTQNEIDRANIFIGIISNASQYPKRVIDEWNLAETSGTPTILLIEKGVNINPDFKGDYVLFDRRYPNDAIQEINRKMSQSKESSSAWPWIIGGALVLGLVKVFSSINDD
ncbi:TIR domain-containing protein [uncultured Kordia sp.]|uniref:TIR domain-containing protein n=1 Tax=uncultured Kordia sp. TaxID=507699 RepID=UPI00261C0AA8|nr:TIR domain-containing protein [uncultured Kordia sp.]